MWRGTMMPMDPLKQIFTQHGQPAKKDNLYTFVGDKTGTYKLDCSNTKIGSWEVISTTYLVYTPLNSIPEAEKVIQMTSIQFKSALAITLPNGQPATITKTWDRQ